uniref:Uncharacterized protein n=1 Tax=Cacopsylla melanoneura TaxID=428564 RepID=A0A8D8QD97_9HEMI
MIMDQRRGLWHFMPANPKSSLIMCSNLNIGGNRVFIWWVSNPHPLDYRTDEVTKAGSSTNISPAGNMSCSYHCMGECKKQTFHFFSYKFCLKLSRYQQF